MRTLICFILLSFLAVPAAAQTSDAELRQLVQRAAQAVENQGNQADRDAAAHALRKAIFALELSGPAPQHQHTVDRRSHRHHRGNRHEEACIDLGFAAYNKAYDERYSLEQAIEKCRESVDSEIMLIAYAAWDKNYDERYAFEKGLEAGRREDLFRKGSLVRLAFDAWDRIYDDITALQKAIEWAAAVDWRDEACIRRAHTIHNKSYDSHAALEMAAETCRR